MDCPSEEGLIRVALGPLSEVQELSFDLPGRKLTVCHDGEVERVLSALEALKFGAQLQSSEETEVPLAVEGKPTERDESRVLKQLLFINALMFVIEGVFGLVAHSTGLLGDSLDMLADAIVYTLSLLAVGQAASKQKSAARFSGWTQMALVVLVLSDVVRKALYGSEPASLIMIGVGLLALSANVLCVWLLRRHREGGVHMQASWLFSTNDALVNLGIVVAGVLVYFTGSPLPDLIAGTAITLLVSVSAIRILRLAS